MKNVNKDGSKFSKKAFYIAIIFSLVAVIITTLIAIGRTMSPMQKVPINANVSDNSAVKTNDEQKNVKKEDSQTSKKPDTADKYKESEKPKEKPVNKKVTKCKFFMPVKGEIIQEFAKV